MSPYFHAVASVQRFGGTEIDYLKIHEFLDSTKFHLADGRHRAILHNTFGMQLCEMVFGPIVKNRDGKIIPVREIARHHIIEDLGKCPTIEEFLRDYKIPPHLAGQVAAQSQIKVNQYLYGDNQQKNEKGSDTTDSTNPQ